MNNNDENHISLVITTYNWVEALAQVVEAIRQQTVMPVEVIIADDGSGQETADYIQKESSHFPIPLIHVWHPDNGFQRSVILNKAIATASGKYIVQIDGDVIPERHFIQDHRAMMEKGAFVCGSRSKLTSVGKLEPSHIINSIRCPLLSRLFANRYGKHIGTHMRGCNLAFWKEDFIAVNGYNEDMTGWGYEDSELAYRMYYHGCRKKVLKFGGIVRHIWHLENAARNRDKNWAIQVETVEKHRQWCTNGVDKYL